MARRVFFSFHYERDIFRAYQVRNSWVTQDREAAGFWDASPSEEAKKKGDEAVKRMINDAVKGTSVTVVLIGKETWGRKWVQYEIDRSYQEGKGLLGVYIHGLKDPDSQTDSKGENPFDYVYYTAQDGSKIGLSRICRAYDWVNDDGYRNLGDWIETAATVARMYGSR